MNLPAAATSPPQAVSLPARGSLFWLAVAPVARGRPLPGALPWSGEDHEAVGVHVQERFDLPETAAAELGQ